jgi:hypothetical protein
MTHWPPFQWLKTALKQILKARGVPVKHGKQIAQEVAELVSFMETTMIIGKPTSRAAL